MKMTIGPRVIVMAFAVGLMLAAGSAPANNMVVTNVTVLVRDASTAYVKFDISWANSWRYTNINHDAAWVFFKVYAEGATNWNRVIMEGSGTNPADYATGTGTPIELIVPPDRVGLFVRRAGEGAGATSVQNVKAVWNFSSNSLVKTNQVRMQAMAVEMVYVAQGSYSLGSGGTGTGELIAGGGGTSPFLVTNAGPLQCSNAVGCLWGASTNGNSTMGGNGTISNNFPNGYSAFYCMKYEITQGQYNDFLNTLTRLQQFNRTASTNADYFAMSANAAMQTKNGIRCPSTIPAAPEPIVFGCDANTNKVFNETNDAMDRACNYLSWEDGCAFADWSGLRPMSELEFEKACRGPLAPVADEYAWGNTNIIVQSGHVGTYGSGTETALPTGANCCYNGMIGGPVRAGIYATGSSSRTVAGASYWGIMELSGNMFERIVTIGNATGRAFTGLNGDGVLSASGDANVSGWPSNDSVGSGYRGGSWADVQSLRVSDRWHAAYQYSDRSLYYGGGRAVRAAPSGVGP